MLRSRDKQPFWQSTSAEEAGEVLMSSYRDGAGAEALLRAFLAERDCNRPAALFWIAVHGLIVDGQDGEEGAGK